MQTEHQHIESKQMFAFNVLFVLPDLLQIPLCFPQAQLPKGSSVAFFLTVSSMITMMMAVMVLGFVTVDWHVLAKVDLVPEMRYPQIQGDTGQLDANRT